MTKNYYQLLGIEKTASASEIKEAYRKLSKRIHPDLNQGEAFFENYFKEVKEAYETLSDRYKKRMYDIESFMSADVPEEKVSGYSKLINYPKTKILELKLAGLETDLREQTALLQQAETEKGTLNQQLKKYTDALAAAENHKNTLQSELVQLQAFKAKQEAEEKVVAEHSRKLDNQLREQQQVISELKTEQKTITDELQQYRQAENASARLISELEAQLQAQHHSLLAVQAEKQVLDQQSETYRRDLTEINAAKNALQNKIQELEKIIADKNKENKPQPPTSALKPSEKDQRTLILAHEKEKEALNQELETYRKKLAETEKVKNAHQHKLEELTLYKTHQDVKEKQVQDKLTGLEQKLQEQQNLVAAGQTEKQKLAQELERYIKELLATQDYKADLQAKVQALEKEKADQQEKEKTLTEQLAGLETQIQEQQTLLLSAQAEQNALKQELKQNSATYKTQETELIGQINDLQDKLREQQDLFKTAEAENISTHQEKQALVQELEGSIKELLAAQDYKTDLQAKVQALETEKADQQEKEKTLTKQLAGLETQIQEQQTLLISAQAKQNALKQEVEQNSATYKTQETELIGQINNLEEKLTAQSTLIATVQAEKEAISIALKQHTAELQEANKAKNSLQYKIRELETYIASQETKEQALTRQLAELEATLHHQQSAQVEMETETPKEVMHQAAKPIKASKIASETKPGNQMVAPRVNERETKPLPKENELQKEMGRLQSKLNKIATEQPFIIEEIVFFTSKDGSEGGHSFASHKIKYLFPRLRVIMLADQPGKIKLLAKYIKPNGELDFDMRISPRGFSFSETVSYTPNDEYIYLAGWGTDKENNFAVGEHSLEIYNESGRQIGKAKFNIVKKLLRFTEMFQK